MPAAFALAFSGAANTDEQITNLFFTSFNKHVNDQSAPKVESDIKVVSRDNAWLVVPDDTLINAVTGNLQTA
jgi:hypothetical protein